MAVKLVPTFPILQMKKLRHRKVKWLVQEDRALNLWGWKVKPTDLFLACEPFYSVLWPHILLCATLMEPAVFSLVFASAFMWGVCWVRNAVFTPCSPSQCLASRTLFKRWARQKGWVKYIRKTKPQYLETHCQWKMPQISPSNWQIALWYTLKHAGLSSGNKQTKTN